LKDDKILTAGIIGVIATIPCEIFLQISVRLGIADHSEFGLASMLITGNRPVIIIGFFVSSIIAAFISILLVLAFMKLGDAHLTIKCVGVSILMWLVLEFVFTIFFEGKQIPVRQISGYYCHLVGAFIFAITQGILLRKYLFHKTIKNEHVERDYVKAEPLDDKDINTKILEEQNNENPPIENKSIYDINKLFK
jgi:hypothetical protein